MNGTVNVGVNLKGKTSLGFNANSNSYQFSNVAMNNSYEEIDYSLGAEKVDEQENVFLNYLKQVQKPINKSMSKLGSGLVKAFISEDGILTKAVGAEAIIIFGTAFTTGSDFSSALSDGIKTFVLQTAKKQAEDGVQNLLKNTVEMLTTNKFALPKNSTSRFSDLVQNTVNQSLGKVSNFLSSYGGNLASQMGATFGVNIAFNVISDVIGDVIKGEEINVAWGTAIYKGAVMCVFKYSGKLVGAWFGGKFTEAAFTAIGTMVAETTVNAYKTEVGRGAAGVAVVIGGAVGLVIAANCWNPVGWGLAIIGAAVLIGAAIGAFIVYVAEEVALRSNPEWDPRTAPA